VSLALSARRWPLVAALAIGAGSVVVFVARRAASPREATRDEHPFAELHAPRVAEPISIDAEEGKGVWASERGSTGIFKDASGAGMVPYTEAKVRWDERTLYLWLYAGDLDLEGSVTEADGPVARDDSFHVELGHEQSLYALDVSVLGTVSDAKCDGSAGGKAPIACDPSWKSGAVVAVDRDGTLNKVGDNDEEWIVEMAVPLSSIGILGAKAGTRIPFAVRRCDVGKGGPRACGSFGVGALRGEIVFDAAVERGPRVARAAQP